MTLHIISYNIDVYDKNNSIDSNMQYTFNIANYNYESVVFSLNYFLKNLCMDLIMYPCSYLATITGIGSSTFFSVSGVIPRINPRLPPLM